MKKQTLPAHIKSWLLKLAPPLLASIPLWFQDVLKDAFSHIQPEKIMEATTWLIAVVFLFLSYLVILLYELHKKPCRKHYDHIEDPGYYVHKKTKEKVCGKCFSVDQKAIPLERDFTKGLKCPACDKLYIPESDFHAAFAHEE